MLGFGTTPGHLASVCRLAAAASLPPGTAMPTVPGLARPDFAAVGLTPAALYHPHTAVRSKTGEEVRQVTGQGSPDLLASNTGPLEMTDRLGRRFWRFRGTDALDLPVSFVSSPRAITVLMIGRDHEWNAQTSSLFGHSYTSDGTTPANTLRPVLNLAPPASNAPRSLGTGSNYATKVAGGAWFAPGSQLSLMGVASRQAANGGARFFCGHRRISTGVNPSTLAECRGAQIGGWRHNNSSGNIFDLYCMAVFTGELTDAQADAAADRLLAAYALQPITRQLVLEGDSVTDGVGSVDTGNSLAMALTEPGAGLVPTDVRVLNMGVSGNQVTHLVTKRDAAFGWATLTLPGGLSANRMVGLIGRNDVAAGGRTGDQVADAVLTYLQEPTVGVLARGWSPTWVTPIASGSSLQPQLDRLRARLRDPAWPTPILQLDRVEEPAGQRRFETSDQAADTAIYQGDATHPTIVGTRLMATGGATPQHGYRSLIAG